MNKNNSVISNENKEVLLNYIENVNKSNKKVRDIAKFTIAIEDVKEDLDDNQERIEELETTIYEKNLGINKLYSTIESKDITINNQNTKIKNLTKENYKLNE